MDSRDLIGALFWLGIAALGGMQAISLGIGTLASPGPGFILFLSSLTLGTVSAILIIVTKIKKKVNKTKIIDLWRDLNWSSPAIAVVAILLYAIFLPKAGYILSSVGLMLLLFGVGRMKMWITIAYTLITVMVTFILFRVLLQVPLPRGVLGF